MANGQATATPPSDGGLQWTPNPGLQTQTAAPPTDGGLQWTPNPALQQPASQPGAYQTRKGGPVLNANNPPAPISRADQVAGAQAGIGAAGDVAGSIVPGGKAAVGAIKGLYQTGLGGAALAAKALNMVGLHSEEVDRLARGDVSPFSEAMTKPVGFEEHAGAAGEGLAEWLAGEEGIKALEGLAKLPQASRLVKALMNVGKSATLGAVQGGVKGAAENEAGSGTVAGAIGGGLGGTVAETIAPGLKALGRIFGLGGRTGEEAMVAAGRPSVGEDANFRQALQTAAPRIVEASKDASLKTVGEFEDILHDTAQDIRQKEFGPMIQRNAKQMVSAQPVAENIRSAITDQMREYSPEEANELEDFAVKFAKDMPLGKAESDLQYFNAQLKKFYKANAVDQNAALKTSGTVAKYEAAADGLRDLIYGRLKELGEKAPEDLQKQYGALKTLERTFAKRATVADRQAPLNLAQILSLAGGAGEAATALLTGHPLAAVAGAVPMAVSTAAKLRNAPESLIRQGVKALTKEAAPKVPSVIGEAAKTGAAATGAQAGQWVRMLLSDGSQIESHPEDVSEVQKRDPEARIVQ